MALAYIMRTELSQKLFERAKKVIPGGVDSPVRAFRSVGRDPLFIAKGEGAYIYDVDGNRFIDYVGSWGPLILGHAAPLLVEAVQKAAQDGTSFGATTEREIELAELVIQAVPSVEKIRFVNSGTEATMSALRLARAFTKKNKLLKFAGCYHGHGDAFLSEAGSGVATFGIPGCDGVTVASARDTLTVPFNDLFATEEALKNGDVAAIIVEPIACNMGMVRAAPEFLAGLRKLCDTYATVLIFDEVITGFRVGLSGAQGLYNVRPDLTTFGKIIGGGLPVGAYGGRSELMDMIAPLGPVYQAGTLSGNPLAMAAGIATLKALTADVYNTLEIHAASFENNIQDVLAKHGNPAFFQRVGSIFHLWFKAGSKEGPRDYAEIKNANGELFKQFFSAMLEQNIYLAPSAFEVGFISLAHSQQHLEATVFAMDKALAQILR
jgi:glutamate-1-semialdehyde 2,1-aminomutase